MKYRSFEAQIKKAGVGLLTIVLTRGAAWACARGCGIFDVGSSSLMPERAAGTAFLNHDSQNQNENWSGPAAAPDDSGYQRVLLAPGLEFNLRPVKFYADAEIPVYQNVAGGQLIAPVLFKVSASYTF